ncbi:MAG: ATP-binding protein, partial [Patescibacteria group bacterium]
FPRSALEALRQPIEDGVVTVSRAAATVQYPARFMLVAAMNPCPCGFLTDTTRQCTCTGYERVRYRKKVSGPLLDRIDLVVDVPKIGFEKLTTEVESESSIVIRKRVVAARLVQRERGAINRQMNTTQVKQFCILDEQGLVFMKAAMEQLHLSPRAFTRVLKVARTIADLAGEAKIAVTHLAEAVQFRPKLDLLG